MKYNFRLSKNLLEMPPILLERVGKKWKCWNEKGCFQHVPTAPCINKMIKQMIMKRLISFVGMLDLLEQKFCNQ